MKPLLPLLLVLLTCACGDDDSAGEADAASADAMTAADANTPDATPPICLAGSSTFPRAFDMPEAASNGIFDPSFARDPATGRMWASYSGVVGLVGDAKVSTHLSYSDDDGITWCYRGEVNPATDVPRSDQPADIATDDGNWAHEVSSLFHDPGAPADKRWNLIWHRYLHVEDNDPKTENRRFQYGWIAQRSAASVAGLFSAPETKLFSALAYHAGGNEPYNNAAPGGLPEKRWDLDANLGNCLAFTEPGALVIDGAVYVAMYCFRSQSQQDVVLVKRSGGAWSFVNVLLDTANAQAFNPGLEGFNAPDIVRVGSGYRVIVSPLAQGAYLGCLEYELDTTTETLSDPDGDGNPNPLSGYEKNPSADVFQTGACTYDENSPLGLIVGDTHLSGTQFRLIATGQSL